MKKVCDSYNQGRSSYTQKRSCLQYTSKIKQKNPIFLWKNRTHFRQFKEENGSDHFSEGIL